MNVSEPYKITKNNGIQKLKKKYPAAIFWFDESALYHDHKQPWNSHSFSFDVYKMYF